MPSGQPPVDMVSGRTMSAVADAIVPSRAVLARGPGVSYPKYKLDGNVVNPTNGYTLAVLTGDMYSTWSEPALCIGEDGLNNGFTWIGSYTGRKAIFSRAGTGYDIRDDGAPKFGFLVGVVYPSAAELYWNGRLVGSAPFSSLSSPPDIFVGSNTLGEVWDGELGLAAAWNRPLAPAEVRALSADPFAPFRPAATGAVVYASAATNVDETVSDSATAADANTETVGLATPLQPALVLSKPVETTIRLDNTNLPDPNADDWVIERSVDAGAWTKHATVTAWPYDDEGLANGTYSYRAYGRKLVL